MNYFKGLVSNVRGFYSEINSATLTGAIDVIVIQQEEGGFAASPFHVRFGKLGVLRSREKIVDILINGEPVDLQMKLGDAGEAFFVEEVEEPSEVPSELSTTPIPSSFSLSGTIDENKEEENLEDNECETPTEDDGIKTPTAATEDDGIKTLAATTEDNGTKTPTAATEDSGTKTPTATTEDDGIKTLTATTEDDETLTAATEDSGINTPTAATEDNSTTAESKASETIAELPKENDTEKPIKKEENEKEITSETVKDSETKDDEQVNVETLQDSNGSLKIDSDVQTKEEEDTVETTSRDSEKLEESQTKDDVEEDIVSEGLVPDLEKNKEDATDGSIEIPGNQPEVHENNDSIEDTDMKVTEEDENSHSHSQSIPIPGRHEERRYSESDSTSWMTDSASLVKEERFKIDHLYPLSDLDSPIGSPPNNSGDLMEPSNPQHCLSDTEAEIQQSQGNMNVINQVTWDWGKLPQGPEGVYKHERNLNDKREEGSHGYRNKRKDFYKSHKVKSEGIYLDDLTTIDQEIAALYLNQALSKDARKAPSIESPTTTEDRESGIGQSLPSSPTSELSSIKDSIGSETYSNIAISLCGDLKSGKVPLETFMKSLVTFDDLSSNPALLSDPKLVIRINDRYYNWHIAAPMLMSYIVYQRPLTKATVRSLIKQHMPKKEKRSYYWFSWRQNYDDQSSDEDDFDPTKEKHRPRAHPGSRKPLTTTPDSYPEEDFVGNNRKKMEIEGKERSDTELNDLENEQRLRNVSECTSGNESDVGYRKTTRLTSEQLAKLKLHEGANDIHFSVTTKYQGTAECQATIYLWNVHDRIVISDIDGTITKSDVLGHILPAVGQAWAQSGVAQFFSSIEKNGYKLLYLSARAIGQAQLTRDYLKSVKQDQITIPDGPILLSPASLMKAFHREVIEKKPEEFKIAALRDILGLFPPNKKPFYSGFGNKINDVYSYRAVGVSLSRIFTINHKGEVKKELTTTFQSSYLDLRLLVDQMFPPYKKEQSMKSSGLIAPDEFSAFTYWRNPLPEVDLSELGPDIDEDAPTVAFAS